MRLCRYGSDATPAIGIYDERGIVPLPAAAAAYTAATNRRLDLPVSTELLDYLPPDGPGFDAARTVAAWLADHFDHLQAGTVLVDARLLVPVPRPNKLFLLAGNYADHIREGGGVAAEQAETFPYVFMKPPTTTLTHPGVPIRIPKAAPEAVDWELELAVIIGKGGKHITETNALAHVAGYTVLNDISQRRYRPNPGRKVREKDVFFDWLHGKWFDSFCPTGPCVTSADAVPNPQALGMKLTLNGETRQNASTALQIFPVAAVISFISAMVTLEPGDIISTGTPAGVGHTTGTFLKRGDLMHGWIEGIGTLVTPVDDE